MLAQPHARQPRGNGPERPTNVLGRVRFWIEGIELTDGAVEEEQDDILGGRLTGGRGLAHFAQTQAQERNAAGLQQLAPRNAVAQPFRRSEHAQHGLPPASTRVLYSNPLLGAVKDQAGAPQAARTVPNRPP